MSVEGFEGLVDEEERAVVAAVAKAVEGLKVASAEELH